MARPPKWKSPTAAIRVPAHAVDAVMALAKQLDGSYVQDDVLYIIGELSSQWGRPINV